MSSKRISKLMNGSSISHVSSINSDFDPRSKFLAQNFRSKCQAMPVPTVKNCDITFSQFRLELAATLFKNLII